MNEQNDFDVVIVKVKNISPDLVSNKKGFDFNGARGARFGGRDFFIPAGGSLLVPKTVGLHLAKHLAQAILIAGAPGRTEAELNGKGSERALWDTQAIQDLMDQIIDEEYSEERPQVLSEGDKMAARVEELNKATESPDAEEDKIPVTKTYRDKAQIIKELQAKKVTFDARSSKADLEELLNNS